MKLDPYVIVFAFVVGLTVIWLLTAVWRAWNSPVPEPGLSRSAAAMLRDNVFAHIQIDDDRMLIEIPQDADADDLADVGKELEAVRELVKAVWATDTPWATAYLVGLANERAEHEATVNALSLCETDLMESQERENHAKERIAQYEPLVAELRAKLREAEVTVLNQRQTIADMRSVTHEEQIAHMHREGGRLVQKEIDARLRVQQLNADLSAQLQTAAITLTGYGFVRNEASGKWKPPVDDRNGELNRIRMDLEDKNTAQEQKIDELKEELVRETCLKEMAKNNQDSFGNRLTEQQNRIRHLEETLAFAQKSLGENAVEINRLKEERDENALDWEAAEETTEVPADPETPLATAERDFSLGHICVEVFASGVEIYFTRNLPTPTEPETDARRWAIVVECEGTANGYARKIEDLENLIVSLSDRCHKQSELLSKKAEKPTDTPVTPPGGPWTPEKVKAFNEFDPVKLLFGEAPPTRPVRNMVRETIDAVRAESQPPSVLAVTPKPCPRCGSECKAISATHLRCANVGCSYGTGGGVSIKGHADGLFK